MSDSAILYMGIICFALTAIGMALTIIEFKRMSRSREKLSSAGGRMASGVAIRADSIAQVP